jgi:uncharacterized protein (DUF58 family)
MSNLSQYLDPHVIQQMGRLDLRARFIVEGFIAGLHSSPFHGLSLEFSEHRKYAQGDDLRTIDWNVFARTDRLFVRKHHAETRLACHLLIDASASMGHVGGETRDPAVGTMEKLEYAVHLAAALGYLVTRQQDAIGLGLIGEQLDTFIPAHARRRHLLHLIAELSKAAPKGGTGLAAGIHAAMERIPHRGLIIVLTDLLTEQKAAMEALHHVRFRGHDLILMHILDAAEARFEFEGDVRLEDPESGETLVTDADSVRERYVEALERWRRELSDKLAAIRADYVSLDTSTPFDKALVEFLVQRTRRL